MTDTRRPTILVVDDVIENCELMAEILRHDYRVVAVHDGVEALDAARATPQPSLILLDVMMHGMDGYEVCRRLQDDLRTRAIPIIFLTALGDVSNEAAGLQAGAVDYLHKPCHPEIMRRRVALHLELCGRSQALESKVRERTADLERTRLEIIRRLGRAGEYRDNETGMHVIRMSQSCHLLALAAGVPEAEAELLLLAAPMHDIGKIGIPDHILLKPGRLDPAEREMMNRHAAIGAEIIGDDASELLALARTVALTHHERWDGKGYPHGRAGEDIPIAGRITAICDVYDALTSERPYKKAWPVDEAVAYIREQAGQAFDPELVALFLMILPEIMTIAARYADAASPSGL